MTTRPVIAIAVLSALITLSVNPSINAAEKKPIADVNVDAMTAETQKTIASDNGLNLVWVIPSEFWQASLAKDKNLPALQRRLILNELNKYIIVGVVRSDISPLGSFRFYDEKSVFDSASVTYTTESGDRLPLKLQLRADNDAQLVIDTMKPILGAALGKMGNNFHLFICEKKAGALQKEISPYDRGTVSVNLARTGQNVGGTADVVFPLDCLYIPRECSQCKKKAHISWGYCPWCGTRHKE